MKILLSAILTLILIFVNSSVTYASLLVIKKDGEIVWNVLADEASVFLEDSVNSYIEVKKVVDKDESGSSVSLSKKNGKISLVVSTESETRELNVSNLEKELIEIENRPEVEKIGIGISKNRFKLAQKGVFAYTDYPVNIDAKKATLSLTTPKGDEFLSVLPFDAVESALRTKILTRVFRQKVEIVEIERELQYKMEGEKVINFMDVFDYSIPITVFVSPASGEIISIDSPTWFKYVKFLFV